MRYDFFRKYDLQEGESPSFKVNEGHLLVIESCPDLPLDALW